MTFVQRARAGALRLDASDLGRPLQDLEVSYRPADLRSALAEVYKSGAPLHLERAALVPRAQPSASSTSRSLPLLGPDTKALGASISFEDVTSGAELDAEHERAKRQLETAYEELQSTVEELETTNEELHSTNEELETTNEELQSTNEELETMNEELQSTNEELETMNEEQRERTVELDRAQPVPRGPPGQPGGRGRRRGPRPADPGLECTSSELWGLRANEVDGEHFFALDIGLPVEQLKEPLRAALGDEPKTSELEVPAVTRRGRSIACSVRVQPLMTAAGDNYGALLLMADATSRSDQDGSG